MIIIMHVQIQQLLPMDCGVTFKGFCKVKMDNITSKTFDNTFFTFGLSEEDDKKLALPLKQLLIYDVSSGNYYYAFSYQPVSTIINTIETFRIIFGAQVVESFYLIYNYQSRFIGMANKLIAQDVNLDDFSLSIIVPELKTADGIRLERARSACSSNVFRSFNNATKDCELALNVRFLYALLGIILIMTESYSYYRCTEMANLINIQA